MSSSSLTIHLNKVREAFVEHDYPNVIINVITRKFAIIANVSSEVRENYEQLQRGLRLAVGNTKIKGISCYVDGGCALVRIDLHPGFYTYKDESSVHT